MEEKPEIVIDPNTTGIIKEERREKEIERQLIDSGIAQIMVDDLNEERKGKNQSPLTIEQVRFDAGVVYKPYIGRPKGKDESMCTFLRIPWAKQPGNLRFHEMEYRFEIVKDGEITEFGQKLLTSEQITFIKQLLENKTKVME